MSKLAQLNAELDILKKELSVANALLLRASNAMVKANEKEYPYALEVARECREMVQHLTVRISFKETDIKLLGV